MRLADTFLAVGIAVIFALLIGYGLHLSYDKPSNMDKERYGLNLFIILMFIGLIAIIVSALLIIFANLNSLGSGLLRGGVIISLYGFARSFELSREYLGFSALFTVFILLAGVSVFVNLIKRDRRTQ